MDLVKKVKFHGTTVPFEQRISCRELSYLWLCSLAGNLSVACFYKQKEVNGICWFLESAFILHGLSDSLLRTLHF